MLDADGHVTHHGGERTCGAIRGCVAHEHAESVRVALDVVQQTQRGVLQDQARTLGGLQGGLEGGDQGLNLTVDNDGIQTFLAAEVLVDDGLGDFRSGGDLLDAGCPEPLFGEQGAPHGNQLLAACEAAHPCPLLSHASSITRDEAGAGWAFRARGSGAFESVGVVRVLSPWTHSALV